VRLFWDHTDYLTAVIALVDCLQTVPDGRSHSDRAFIVTSLREMSTLPLRQRSRLSREDLERVQRRMQRRDRVATATMLLVSSSRESDVSLDKVAATLHVTESYLSRAIAADTGLTYARLLHAARLTDAVVALGTTDLPIKHIAYDVGYKRANEMDRAFSAWFHIPPRDFRAIARSAAAPLVAMTRDDARGELSWRRGGK
jgi:AraC-like DNA-binding protein